jgi:kynurenine formamidase
MESLIESMCGAQVYDLAQTYRAGMPHVPTHPPFLFGTTKLHGDVVSPAGTSSVSDAMALGTHNGTHIDALCHFSSGGKLYGGEAAAGVQSYGGIGRHGAETIAPIVRRGVLLDIAGLEAVESLPREFEIAPAHLDRAARAQGVDVRRGDVVLLRTGWGQYWRDPPRFVAQGYGPGPGIAGARWLSARGVFAAGADTLAFERVPAADKPVHVHLLVESGIHIMECLNLEELAAQQKWTFLFVAAPLKIEGATGAPVRPLAVVA